MNQFFHYTCACCQRRITRYGTLQTMPFGPNMFGRHVIWLTDMDPPDRTALGLTSHSLKCDRLDYRYHVAACAAIRPWIGSPEREYFWRQFPIDAVNFERGRQPTRWWISSESLPAVLDRSYRREARRPA